MSSWLIEVGPIYVKLFFNPETFPFSSTVASIRICPFANVILNPETLFTISICCFGLSTIPKSTFEIANLTWSTVPSVIVVSYSTLIDIVGVIESIFVVFITFDDDSYALLISSSRLFFVIFFISLSIVVLVFELSNASVFLESTLSLYQYTLLWSLDSSYIVPL